MAIQNFPDVRQNDGFSCGAAASMAVGQYWKVGPSSLGEWKHALGTDVEKSTNPNRIIGYFKSLGMRVQSGQDMTIPMLKQFTDSGIPVICPVQDYGPVRSKKAVFDYGHYLTVIGVFSQYILCQDSSEDNIIKPGSDSVQAPGKIVIGSSEWMNIWHDRDVYDEPYINFGIAVSPP
jgi:hypothetical protein